MSYNDLIRILRGIGLVMEASIKYQNHKTKLIWDNSSFQISLLNCSINSTTASKCIKTYIKDLLEVASIVIQGSTQYAIMVASNLNINSGQKSKMDQGVQNEIEELNIEFNEILEFIEKKKSIDQEYPSTSFTNETTALPLESQPPVVTQPQRQINIVLETPKEVTAPKPKAHKKLRISLSKNSKEQVVPSSRISRILSFGSLAAGLGVGTVAQYARNTINSVSGRTENYTATDTFLSPANAKRIVDTLCKVRGAALKLGQLLSIQDESVMPPEMMKIFERVRQSADFMPAWQVEKVMVDQFGADWRSHLQYFEDKPFAAASVGQVHLAILHDNQEVAMKIQYPGVARGINSDIDNLVAVLKIWNAFPKGMFINNIVDVAKKELAWEVDYIREAEFTRKFKKLLEPYPEYYVPLVIDQLCAKEVITTELVDGVPLEKLFDANYEIKYDIARKIMMLCLREMFLLRCMQTDPNWANFLYNLDTKQVILLDFGATREYSKKFMDQYIAMIKAATENDRETILRISKEMKFLTGYESQLMEDTHVDTIMIMGEIFITKEEFDFGGQNTTRRIQALVPTIVTHRLCPPPEELYSLHRKLSGVFLLCAKLKVKLNCGEMFQDIYEQYSAESR